MLERLPRLALQNDKLDQGELSYSSRHELLGIAEGEAIYVPTEQVSALSTRMEDIL